MRSTDERIAAMHTRAAEIKREQIKRRNTIIGTVSVLACFAVVIGIALAFPSLMAGVTPTVENDSMIASIFSGNGYLGYIVIGTLAFLLGAAVTVFCVRLQRLNGYTEDSDSESKYD